MSSITTQKAQQCPRFAWIILVAVGIFNLVRGFMHTINVEYAAVNIAGLDLTYAREDQLFLLINYGLSNFLTGIIFIVVGLKARHLVPLMLAIICVFSLIGMLVVEIMPPTSDFSGRTLGIIYFLVNAGALAVIYVKRRSGKDG